MRETVVPTVQWLTAHRDGLNESGALDDIGSDWGVGFDGDVLVVITDLPLAATTLADRGVRQATRRLSAF